MGFPDAFRQISSLVDDFKENEKLSSDYQPTITNTQRNHFAYQLNRLSALWVDGRGNLSSVGR